MGAPFLPQAGELWQRPDLCAGFPVHRREVWPRSPEAPFLGSSTLPRKVSFLSTAAGPSYWDLTVGHPSVSGPTGAREGSASSLISRAGASGPDHGGQRVRVESFPGLSSGVEEICVS